MIGDDSEFASTTRRNIFLAIISLIALAFIGRLVQLQLIEGSEYRSRSEAQGIKQIPVEPVRGAMYDRFGHVVVADVPSYALYVTPNKLTADTKVELARILQTDTATINKRIERYKMNNFSPARIWRDLDRRAWAMLNEFHMDLSGVDVVEESKRMYPPDIRAAHLFGYTKEISPTQLQHYGDYYSPGDEIGQKGIERAFEDMLRGEKGYELVLVNNRGRRVGKYDGGRRDLEPHNGFDLYLGLDAQLQQYAEQLLKGKQGAVVALEPSTGEILAMASAPDYDPRIFSGVTSWADYKSVLDDPAHPMLNRATQAVYPPGSTWKPLMGIAGLMSGVIDTNTILYCPGSFTFGGHTWHCHGAHGAVNVREAIHVSCNVFFYQVALKLGLDRYDKFAHMFHFGEKLHVDVDEARTLLPSKEYYKKMRAGGYSDGVMPNLGIGQGELLVNPLQLAAYTAAIANGGIWNQPHVVSKVKNKRLGTINDVEYESDTLGIPPQILKIVQLAMYQVVNVPGGTARMARIDSIDVAGKTGTAQAPGGKRDHAWFVAFAPYQHPKIALCVLVENAGFGGVASAPIARKLIRFYLTRHKEPEDAQFVLPDTVAAGSLPPVQNIPEGPDRPDSLKTVRPSDPFSPHPDKDRDGGNDHPDIAATDPGDARR